MRIRNRSSSPPTSSTARRCASRSPSGPCRASPRCVTSSRCSGTTDGWAELLLALGLRPLVELLLQVARLLRSPLVLGGLLVVRSLPRELLLLRLAPGLGTSEL